MLVLILRAQVLFQSANLTGNHTLVDIATSHADKTIINHLRPDGALLPSYIKLLPPYCGDGLTHEDNLGSSFHVVEYNETTGAVIHQGTAQGYADNRFVYFLSSSEVTKALKLHSYSTWSRGQTWGIYGFAQSKWRFE